MTTDGGFGFGFGFDFDFEFDQGGNENFSKLLLSDDVVSHASSSTTSLFSFDTPKMLCFGDFCEEYESGSSQITSQSISSPVSKSSSDASINGLQNSSNCNKRRNGSASPKKDASASREQIGSKKIRSTAGHAKAKKKEKLGDRIATLQQLVSPYGKADTASVLHETMGYIRFLQNQVDVLCSPYLQRIPTTSRGENYEHQKSIQGLQSKGLCLVPISGIVDMASSNGADLWSPVTSKAITPANVVDPRPSSIC